ncbi:MAG: Flp pilus assembly complex ATPase component TadA [Bacilli bacterium]|nr:Flp pilus assembly complex ATPase component TadA [Bacilli bacterium]
MTRDSSEFLESSFLSPLLKVDDINDISFNGQDIYYVSVSKGRMKSDIRLDSEKVGDFLRQIANLQEKQFSFTHPVLDVSFGRYRLNAVYKSIGRLANSKVFTFSLRVESFVSKIDKDKQYFKGDSKKTLLNILKNGESLVIGGETSTGKTELEKWLLSQMEDDTRVVVIDNIEELDVMHLDNVDMTCWIVNDSIQEANFNSLIRTSLRNNPDYIVVAEARGGEMYEALLSAMSGHPLISSIHAKSLEDMPHRVARLCMMGDKRVEFNELMEDINSHIENYVYLKKKINDDGSISRFVESIGHLEKDGSMKVLYRRKSC